MAPTILGSWLYLQQVRSAKCISTSGEGQAKPLGTHGADALCVLTEHQPALDAQRWVRASVASEARRSPCPVEHSGGTIREGLLDR